MTRPEGSEKVAQGHKEPSSEFLELGISRSCANAITAYGSRQQSSTVSRIAEQKDCWKVALMTSDGGGDCDHV